MLNCSRFILVNLCNFTFFSMKNNRIIQAWAIVIITFAFFALFVLAVIYA